MTFVNKVWGNEQWIVNSDKYCGKILVLHKQYRCSIHYHKQKDETFYIMNGAVLMELDGEKQVMHPGESIRVLPGQKHRFTGLSNAMIVEFSTHHEDDDSYRESTSGFVPDDEFCSLSMRQMACQT